MDYFAKHSSYDNSLSGYKIVAYTKGVIETYSILELRKELANEIKILIGKTYLNLDRNITIGFIGDSRRKLAYGSAIYRKKLALVYVVPLIIKHMTYTNWGNRKTTDKSTVVGYFNFKCKVLLDNKPENVKIAIQVRSDGKFYYNHETLYK